MLQNVTMLLTMVGWGSTSLSRRYRLYHHAFKIINYHTSWYHWQSPLCFASRVS